MAYTKLTDFAVKDALLTGNPAKVVRGTEIDAELNAIAAADALNLSAASIVAATSKATPIDADLIPLIDSAASNVLKKLTWANLKATVKTYFDTLYLGISATAANASQLLGATWASPGPIGSTTPSTGAFTALSSTTNTEVGLSLAVSSGTDAKLQQWTNAGGTYTIGVDRNTGGYFGSAYAFGINAPTGKSIRHLINSSVITETTSTGLSVTGVLSASGKYAITGNGSVPASSALEIGSNGVGSRWLYNAPTGGEHNLNVNGSIIAYVNGVGAGVNGALSTTGRTLLGGSASAEYLAVKSPNASTYINIETAVDSGVFIGNSGGSLLLNTSGINRVTLDSAGNLGLGVTPSAWTSGTAIQNQANSAWFSDGGATYFLNNAYYSSGFKYTASGTAMQYTLSSSGHTWYTAPSGTAGNTVTFTQSLAVGKGTTLALEGATSAAGTGIAFPATQLASSNANTLDDYEEGTFTPTIVGTTTAGTGTYTAQSGSYTKIGRKVTCHVYLNWSAHTGTGNLAIASLPFAASGAANTYYSASIGDVSNITLTASNIMTAYVGPGNTQMVVKQTPVGGGASSSIPMDTSGIILLTIAYEV